MIHTLLLIDGHMRAEHMMNGVQSTVLAMCNDCYLLVIHRVMKRLVNTHTHHRSNVTTLPSSLIEGFRSIIINVSIGVPIKLVQLAREESCHTNVSNGTMIG